MSTDETPNADAVLTVSRLPEGVALESKREPPPPRQPGRELLIGCGSNRDKRVVPAGEMKDFENLTCIDQYEGHHLPSDREFIRHDLNMLPLPLKDDSFTSIHAYEVLEHLGHLGNAKELLNLFAEFWRILKPGGLVVATVPRWDSLWAFGDPDHKRVINRGTLVFFSQPEYRKQVGKTPMSDFRSFYKADFEAVYTHDEADNFVFVLKSHKPVRP